MPRSVAASRLFATLSIMGTTISPQSAIELHRGKSAASDGAQRHRQAGREPGVSRSVHALQRHFFLTPTTPRAMARDPAPVALGTSAGSALGSRLYRRGKTR